MLEKEKIYLKSHWPFLFIIVIIALLNVFFRTQFFPDLIQGDTGEYISNTKFWQGESEIVPESYRITKPLSSFFVIFLSYFGRVSWEQAILCQAIIFYFALAFLMYAFLNDFFRSRFISLIGTLFFISCYPFLYYGLGLLIDGGGWFLNLLAVYGVWRYHLDFRAPWLYFSSAVIGLGLLWKEYTLIAGVLLFLCVVLKPVLTWRQKIVLLGRSLIIVLAIVMPWYIYILNRFGPVVADYYLNPFQYGLLKVSYFMTKSLFALLLLGWIPALAGIRYLKGLPPERKLFLYYLLIASGSMFIYGSMESRVYFPLAVPLIMIALLWFQKLVENKKTPAVVFFLGLIILSQYAWLYLSGPIRPWLGQFTVAAADPWPWITFVRDQLFR